VSKRVLIAVSLLALAQAGTSVWLAARMGDTPAMQADPAYPIVLWEARAAFARDACHLLGTLLAIPWLIVLPSLAPLGKLPRALFVPLGISTLSWLGWVVEGLPAHDRSWSFKSCGYLGLMLGTMIPVAAMAWLAGHPRSTPEDRAVVRRGMLLAALILLWSWAFLIIQAEVVLGVFDLIRASKR
jgi:hypothetical protein